MLLASAVSVGVAVAIDKAAQLSPIAGAALAVLFLIAIACLTLFAVLAWLRVRARARLPLAFGPEARYLPIVLPLGILAMSAYLIAGHLASMSPGNWRGGSGDFALLCFMTAVFAMTSAQDWRRRASRAGIAVAPGTQRSIEQIAEARRFAGFDDPRAMRRIVTRGYIRLGLIGANFVLMFSLAPFVGMAWAAIVSVVAVSGIFLIGRRLFGL